MTMAGLLPKDLARLREKAEQLNRAASHAVPRLTPHDVETLVHELRVHQIELELQCQELQRAHEEVEESRNRYRELYESIPVGYVTIDGSGKMYDLNPAGASLLGLDPGKRLSHNLFFFFPEADADAAILFSRKVLAQQQAQVCDLKMRRMDKSTFLAALQAGPVQTGEGKGERLRIAYKDISRQKEMEEALRQHQADLEANRIELQDLMTKLLNAQEEERRRIACDLHDDHCQRITALILEASFMEKLIRSTMPSLLPHTRSLKEKLNGILDDFRHMTHELHPRHLDTVSLACSMRTYLKEFKEYSDLQIDFDEWNMPSHLPMPVNICLYRLLQESLGNIRKHASAKRISIQLSGGQNEVELLVSDDGSGFNPADFKKGLGMISMQERVRPLRGHISVTSEPGKGTRLAVKIPVPAGQQI
jgi:PAS domain S-box-containing protein